MGTDCKGYENFTLAVEPKVKAWYVEAAKRRSTAFRTVSMRDVVREALQFYIDAQLWPRDTSKT